MFAALSLMTITSCKKNTILRDYPSLRNTINIVEYVEIDEVLKTLSLNDNQKRIIVFGFKSCDWCQTAIIHINDVAREKGYGKIMYLDIKDMRDNLSSNEHEKYLELYQTIKEEIGNPPKIYAPTVIVVKNGKIIGSHEGTLSEHQKIDGNLPQLNNDQIDKLKEIYRSFF